MLLAEINNKVQELVDQQHALIVKRAHANKELEEHIKGKGRFSECLCPYCTALRNYVYWKRAARRADYEVYYTHRGPIKYSELANTIERVTQFRALKNALKEQLIQEKMEKIRI
jgi:hypothetical protein